MVRKKVDSRVRQLIENSVKLRQRGLFVLVGDHGKDQVVNLHLMLSKTQVKARPSVLWCYKKELGFSTHRKKRMRQIKKAQERGTYDAASDDPFDLFVSQTDIRWCYYKDSQKALGQTFGMLVLQDFEAMTPNLLARTVETVEGGGLVVLLLRTVTSLKQLYTMTMDCHERFRTEQHGLVVPRFNERFILSLSGCRACLVLDDELNILPISGSEASPDAKGCVDARSSEAVVARAAEEAAGAGKELSALVKSLADAQPSGALAGVCKTLDQARAVLTFLDAVSEKRLRSTVALTAARGRGKSAALGICLAGAVAYGYANIFVTAPSPENLHTVFEFVLKGLDALHYEEHLDYEVLQATDPALNKAVVRINLFKGHRQTIQYIDPKDHARLAQAELLVIDEAAAIPLPTVKKLLGPYLVFMASTVNGYEGTGRSLSLKLLSDLRKRQGQASYDAAAQAGEAVVGSKTKKGARKVHEDRWRTAAEAAKDTSAGAGTGGRTLREIELTTPIRYASGDAVESWLNELLCLDVHHRHASAARLVCGTPAPRDCELYRVDRDALFSLHSLSEAFLQRVMSMYTAAHYKNSPNDLQLLSDAPGHELFVLLGPQMQSAHSGKDRLPDVLCVVQVAFEGKLSREAVGDAAARGRAAAGDLIPWTLSQQFGDDRFATLAGARIVRIATHPDVQRMGYGGRAMELLLKYFKGDLLDLDAGSSDEEDEEEEAVEEGGAAADEGDEMKESDDESGEEGGDEAKELKEARKALRRERAPAPRSKLPPLLVPVAAKRPPQLDWCGVSFGVTPDLLNFWLRRGFLLCYLRQTANETTGEHTAVLLCDFTSGTDSSEGGAEPAPPLGSSAPPGAGKKRRREGGDGPARGWLEAFVEDARRRLVNLLGVAFKDSFTSPVALSLLGGGAASVGRPRLGFDVGVKGSGLTAAELGLFVGPHDLKRLDMYARNMVDHHLVADLVPTLARLFFLGHLNGPPGGGKPGANKPGGGGGVAEEGLSLSMVQKALLLGMGLQSRDVDRVAAELTLPTSQVLALFNKAVRKLNSYLKLVVERDAEREMLERSEAKAGEAGRSAVADRRAVRALASDAMAATGATLAEDLEDGAEGALAKLHRGGGRPTQSKGGVRLTLLEDEELNAYTVKGDEGEWQRALAAKERSGGGTAALSGTLSLQRDASQGDATYGQVSAAVAAAAIGAGGGRTEKLLAEAAEEAAAAAEAKGKKKKRPRILGGGFNEEAKVKKNKKKGGGKGSTPKKPTGKYKNQ